VHGVWGIRCRGVAMTPRKPNKKTCLQRFKVVDRFLADKGNEDALRKTIQTISGKTFLPNVLDTREEVWHEVRTILLTDAWRDFSASDDRLRFVKSLTRTVAQRKEFVRPPTEYSNASPVKLNGDVSISVQSTKGESPDPNLNCSRGMAGKNFYVRTKARLYCQAHSQPQTQAVLEIVSVQRQVKEVSKNPFTNRKPRPVKVEVCTVRLECGCVRTIDFDKKWAGRRSAADRLDLTAVPNDRNHERALVDSGTAVDMTYEVYDHEAEDGVLTVELNESIEGRIDSHIEFEPELDAMGGLIDRVDDIDAGETDEEIGKSSTVRRRPDIKLFNRTELQMLDRIQRKRDGKVVWDESPIACMGTAHHEFPDDVMTDYEVAALVLGFDIGWYWQYRWETAQSGSDVRGAFERSRYSEMNDRIAKHCAVMNRKWLRKVA
jgi:hypothetical protein